MGIKGLGKFIGDFAPRAIKRQEVGSFTSRIIAIDASMSLYQFMVAIRDGDSFGNFTNDAGECTSHIAGMLNRAIRLLEQGIRPVYVFDGKPPELKSGELAKRREVRDAAQAAAEKAKEEGDAEELRKQIVRSVRVSKQHNEDVQRLLRLMGLPVVLAPCEAEAQCAELTKKKKVWAAATEDADALTFGATRLIRNLTFSEKKPAAAVGASGSAVLVIDLPVLLEELQFSQEQFIDFCILCGCDYCSTLKGVGAKTAYSLIREHGSLENVLKAVDPEKVPESYPFREARALFIEPEVTPAEDIQLSWGDVDVEGLKTFLVKENQFSEQRVENYIQRLKKAKGKTSQTRLESFFGAATTKSSSLMQKQQLEKQKELEKKKSRGVRGFATTAKAKSAVRTAAAEGKAKQAAAEAEPRKEPKKRAPEENVDRDDATAAKKAKHEGPAAAEARGKEEEPQSEKTAPQSEKTEPQSEAAEAEKGRGSPAKAESGDQLNPASSDAKSAPTKERTEEAAASPSATGGSLFEDGEGEENIAPSEVCAS
ncbi:putative flap structure-specific endonuclease 1 [Besnoitia besnoiti]|uniref:Flap endonuclease 1 n=1 Tax=Besnoitia besnoiti TaxID=94643 RepID=A0A2A9M732_BESBE|nr:putative flap structure-specific endonuclease 1 [Besnoitia besnoiti]PFH31453.1 putative flap structure-specific endonuclease 1 [Besnoitia besnoiti]